MEELKFRAWDKKKKKFIYFDFTNIYGHECIHGLEVSGVILPDMETALNYNSGYGNKGFNRDLIIEQYTSFKDKDRKEIYGGMIIRGFQEQKGIIEFSDGTFWVRFVNKQTKAIADFADVPHIRTALGTLMNGCDGKHVKIIGNIHENPELLEKS